MNRLVALLVIFNDLNLNCAITLFEFVMFIVPQKPLKSELQ